jgi:hypothetical protein
MQDLPKWEYQFVGFMLDKKTADISEHTLNREGENGWEIVAVMDGEHYRSRLARDTHEAIEAVTFVRSISDLKPGTQI